MSTEPFPEQPQTKEDFYTHEENRLHSFQSLRLVFDPAELAHNGLYRVLLKETLKNQGKQIQSQMDQLSLHVPSLIHLKCAFCPYECLISKKSPLNTHYKCPIQEHLEKFSASCHALRQPLNTTNKPDPYPELDWYKCLVLLEDDRDSYETELNELVQLNPDGLEMNTNNLIVNRIPKAIDQVIAFEANRNKRFIYAPNDLRTNDFTRLRGVLDFSGSAVSGSAYHPDFQMHHARLESFRSWPSHLSQRPEELARAGFYYFGVKDMVKCFFCNGGLKDWAWGDDPCQDHVRWFPKCQFIRQLMGAEYIEQMR